MATISNDSKPATTQRLLNTFYYKRTIKRIIVFSSVLILGVTFPIASYFLATEIFDTRERAVGTDTFIVCPTGDTDPECDYLGGDGIKEAIDEVNVGGVAYAIYIKNGTYTPSSQPTVFSYTLPNDTTPQYEKVYADLGETQMTIEGESKEGVIIDGTIDDTTNLEMSVFAKKAGDPVTIKNVTIKNFDETALGTCTDDQNPCVHGSAVFQAGINDITLTNAAVSIYTTQGSVMTYGDVGSTLTLTNNEFVTNSNALVIDSTAYTEVSVQGNTFTDCANTSIYARGHSTLTVTENTYTGSQLSAIIAENTTSADIIDNEFTENRVAFTGSGTGTFTITGNHMELGEATAITLSDDVNFTISGNTITKNYIGISVGLDPADSSTGSITNNLVYANTEQGIFIYSGSHNDIFNNTINGNGTAPLSASPGGIILSGDPPVDIFNNIITGNSYAGIKRLENTSVNFNLDYNNVYGNTDDLGDPANYVGFTDPPDPNEIGANSISEDPLYVSDTDPYDFHLGTGSPCIDAGTGSVYDPIGTDPDGSDVDMGAYGGPDACILDSTLPGCPDAPVSCEYCTWGQTCNTQTDTCEDDPSCNLTQFITCTEDADCVKVDKGPCPCENGGEEIAVHTDYTDEYATCIYEPPGFACLTQVYNCTDRIPICKLGRCSLSIEETSDADIDGDGDVDMTDYYWFVQDYLYYKEGHGIKDRSDLNGDEVMSMVDYSLFVEAYLEARGL